uniref:Ribosomal protein L16 n=1 Tax=Herposiphonia versicolor TaxID=2007163 RepID=UPI0022FD3A2C|nr:Ribosomal protein L16 [Herposiphonia versicolor]WAX04180.1 Ribosomal protein L16 [Herposiphonia versicolor]
MAKKNLIQKKTHFNFQNFFSFNKHILKFGKFGFKIKFTLCVSKNKFLIFKLFLLKNLKLLNNNKIKIFILQNFYFTKTKLPLESRMGKGKGEIVNLFGYYKKGFILFELTGISFFTALKLKKILNKKNIFQFYLV